MDRKSVSRSIYKLFSILLLASLMLSSQGLQSVSSARAQEVGSVTMTPQVTNVSTAAAPDNWLTYTANDFGYSIQYPSTYSTEERADPTTGPDGAVPSDFWFGQRIHVITRIPALPDDLIASMWGDATSVTLPNGTSALRHEQDTGGEGGADGASLPIVEYLIRGDGADYILSYNPSDLTTADKSEKQIFEGMVAAFTILPERSYQAPLSALAVPQPSDGFDYPAYPTNGSSGLPSGSLRYNQTGNGDKSITGCYGVAMWTLQHSGEDYMRSANSTVYAASNGIVTYSQYVNYPGSVVIIQHNLPSGVTSPWGGSTIYTMYAHINPSVSVNQIVKRGQPIGTVFGQGSNSHLHFEMRRYADMRSAPHSVNGYIFCPNRAMTVEGPGYTARNSNPDWYGYTNPSSWIQGHRPYTGGFCPQSGGVILYWQENYGCSNTSGDAGFRQVQSAGSYNIDSAFVNRTYSVKIPANWSVMLYTGPLPSGGLHNTCFNASTPSFQTSFGGLNIRQHIAALRVFTSRNCGGLSGRFLPLSGAGPDSTQINSAAAPNMPQNLVVSGADSDSVTLHWDDMSSDETGFNIYKWGFLGGDPADPANWAFQYYGTVPANTTTVTDTGLGCSNDFNYYLVTAFNGSGESNAAGWVQGITTACAALTNDDISSPTFISGTSYTASLNASSATWVPGDPNITNCNLVAPDGSLWYTFTAPANGQLYVDTSGSNYDTVLAVWSGTPSSLNPVSCNDDTGESLQSTLSADLQAGTTYYIEAGKFYDWLVSTSSIPAGKAASQSRDITSLSIDLLTLNVQFVSGPSNDAIEDAKNAASLPYSDTIDTTGATRAPSDQPLTLCYRDPGMASVWYTFTAPATGQISIDTMGSDYDTMLALWTGSPGNLNLTGCNDDYASTLQSYLTADVTSGTTYYIEVPTFWDYSVASLGTQSGKPPAAGGVTAQSGGSLHLQVSFVAGPSNDEPSGATVIGSIPYNDTPTTLGATAAPTDPAVPDCYLNPGMDSVWYQYTPSADATIYLDTLGSNYDTYIAVWTGSPGGLSAVGCNDDYDSNDGIYQSALQVDLTASTTYYIEIAQWNGYSAVPLSVSSTNKSNDVVTQSGGALQFHVERVYSTTVMINGTNTGNYLIHKGDSMRVNYDGLNSGPVVVQNAGSVPIIAAERDAWWDGTTWSDFAQTMGLPSSQVSDTYVFPAYNNVSLDEQLRFGNVGTADTIVTVTIGGDVQGTYPLHPSESTRVNYDGLNSGPVVVQSSGGVPIIAAERDAWWDGKTWSSYSQLMGLPSSQVSDTYVFPAYNNVSLDEQLRFGNVGTADTIVTVTIGGDVQGTYPLHPSESTRVNYDGLNSGPVVVQSSDGVPIIAAERDAWWDGKTWSDYAQTMGLPSSQVSDTYVFPAYNNVSLDEQLRFGNVGAADTIVTVTIGGVVQGTYPLHPSESTRVNYDGLNSGPVVVQSSDGVAIIVAERDSWWDGKTWSSYSQLMGLPQSQISDTYVFPAYNNISLDEQLRFGVP